MCVGGLQILLPTLAPFLAGHRDNRFTPSLRYPTSQTLRPGACLCVCSVCECVCVCVCVRIKLWMTASIFSFERSSRYTLLWHRWALFVAVSGATYPWAILVCWIRCCVSWLGGCLCVQTQNPLSLLRPISPPPLLNVKVNLPLSLSLSPSLHPTGPLACCLHSTNH